VGRSGSMRDVGGGTVRTAGPEVRIARAPDVLEWWRGAKQGLEQGVTLEARPGGDGPLVLEIAVRGGALPELVSPDDVRLRDAHGEAAWHYAHLDVRDADGARVPARLAVEDGRLRIEVDDARARYPLCVDPLLYAAEEAALAAGDAAGADGLGTA